MLEAAAQQLMTAQPAECDAQNPFWEMATCIDACRVVKYATL